MVKGLPTGYNRDLQETKPPLWAIFDAVKGSLQVLKGVIATLRVNKGRMWEVASKSFVVAVDLAERLVEESVLSFREAHRLVGSLVKEALDRGIKPADLTPEMLEELSERVLKKKITVSKKLIASVVDVWSCVSKRKTLGSPAPKEIDRMLKARRKKLSYHRARLASRVEALEKSREGLMEMVKMHISEKSRRG